MNCVLIESVNANNKELFCERALLPPNTKRSDIEAKIEEAKASNLDKTVVQSYQLLSYQFTKLSGLPNLEQLKLVLKKLPNILQNNKGKDSKYQGVVAIHLFNFDVIDRKVDHNEGDVIISKFGKGYFD